MKEITVAAFDTRSGDARLTHENGSWMLSAPSQPAAIATTDESVLRLVRNARFLVLDGENLTDSNVSLLFAFYRDSDPDEESTPEMHVTLGLFPHLPTRLAFDLSRLDGRQLFLDRTPGKLKSMARGVGIEQESIRRLAIGIARSAPGATIRIDRVGVADTEPDYPLPEITVVDELGQWSGKRWSGKTRDLAELRTDITAACEEAGSTLGSPRSVNSNAPLGFAAVPVLSTEREEASGYFRVQELAGRWLLIDPDGHPFYSIGLDCVRDHIHARVDGIESLFAWLPNEKGEFKEFWHRSDSPFPNDREFDFLGANMKRSLGPEWFPRWARLTEARMRGWGFNTIGNWSSPRFIGASAMPYVVPLSGSLRTTTSIFRDFPDVFSDEYATVCDRHAQQLAAYAEDRRLLGYFIVNEPHWAFEQDLNVAEKLLANPAPLDSREALVAWLSDRYHGDARALAAAWDHPAITSFSDLSRPIDHAASISNRAEEDLRAFTAVLIRRFAETPAQAAKRVDPYHLNLGMRYAYISQDALYETADSFDVFSINRYGASAREITDEIGMRTGKPVLIGEFHHGALDAGLPSNGIRGVLTQAERGVAYRYFVETTAASRFSVGVHYFTLHDQPVLGRFDGENFQIGIVDICQKPYEAFAAAVRQTNEGLPEIVAGARAPTTQEPKEQTVGF